MPEEAKACVLELCRLPGVRLTRALLYYHSGYATLGQIASADKEYIIKAISATIEREQLKYIPPLPKEVNTHIAVAKVLTTFGVK